MGDPSLTQRLLVDPATNAIADRVENLVAALWDYTLGLLVNLILLCRHSEQLEEEMKKLDALKADLKNQAEQQIRQSPPAEVAHQLSRWSGSVDALALKASDFEKSFGDRSLCSISLGHTAVQLLKEVKKLTQEGEALQSGGLLINQRGPDSVQLVPGDIARSTNLVGTANPLQQIKDYIKDEGIGIIGIYGMGGVGKTTLLKITNNEFLMGSEGRHMFDVAIWVTVSREARNIPDIQKTIAIRLGLPSDAPVDKYTLFRELSNRRFVLLIDDVWERLDLAEELGIPLPKNSNKVCKILFTTRSEEVCCEMDADVRVKVGFLDEDSSWELFRSKFGKKDGHHHVLVDDLVIKPLAKEVVAKCGGLPISLIAVGRAMAARAKTEYDWRDAIAKLDHRPADLSPGVENDVLQRLKFSFDMLRSKTLRDCLLYFALFPEDSDIEKEEIIDYWICEGFLDSEPDIEVTRRRGHALITDLQNACLLEVVDKHQQCVSLHDTVRDMALWISKEKYVVLAGRNCTSSQVPPLPIWQKSTRISLTDNEQVEEPPSSCWNLNCPNMTTLLLRNSRLGRNVAHNQGFLTCTNMPALKVLNLDGVCLNELPIGITSLTTLQFLSLQHNDLSSLPVELGKLVNLRHLDLSDNTDLQPIPREALSCLSSLQVLNMRTRYSGAFLQRSELDDLKSLKSLCDLHLRGDGACSLELLQVIAESAALRRSISELKLYSDDVSKESEISIIHKGATPPSFPKLRVLWINGCGYSDLTWIGRIPCLEKLRVTNCEELTEILLSDRNKDDTGSFFPKLQEMTLEDLPSLRSISTRTLLLPFLEELYVGGCPELWRLPWNGDCSPKLRVLVIEGCSSSDLTWIGRLPCLEKLEVKNCKELTEILLSDGNKDDTDDRTVGSFFPKLQEMTLWNLPSLRSISTRTLLLPSLEKLYVFECPELWRLPWNGGLPSFPKLRVLDFNRCGCSDLTLIDRLPCLEKLRVWSCKELTEILLSDGIMDDSDDQTVGYFFPKLQEMTLWILPSLRSISTRTLLLPFLEELRVYGCPELRRLPLGRDSAPNIRMIKGSKTWWDGLDWEEITMQERFASHFVDINGT